MSEKHNKKQTLVKGVSLHVAVYVIIALLLLLVGIPSIVVFSVVAVMVWGLLVMSYAYYYHK